MLPEMNVIPIRSVFPALPEPDNGIASRDAGGNGCIGYAGDNLEKVQDKD